jgi:Ca2+-binding EF-hand superfamily protein
MDESGDGSITHRELIIGFKKVLGEDIAEEEAIKIFNRVMQVDLDGNGSLDFKDFLISSVDLADRDYIMTYMKNAYL